VVGYDRTWQVRQLGDALHPNAVYVYTGTFNLANSGNGTISSGGTSLPAFIRWS
jgi:hypothetical protein